MKRTLKILFLPILLLSFSNCNKDKLAPPEEVAEEGIVEGVFQVVEDMPTFPGCENTGDKAAYQECSTKKMLEFIYKNVEYPQVAIDNAIEGTVVIRFIVDIDGSIRNPEIVREIGGGCGTEALRVVKLMPLWNPGKQRGEPVKVYFNLPIKFKW